MEIIDWIKNVGKLDQIKKMCLKKYQSGDMKDLDAAMRMLYNQDPKNATAVFTYIAKNTRCDDRPRVKVTEEYMTLWSKLDPLHYNEYRTKLKQAYIADVSKLSKSSVQKFLNTCQVAITKPQYAAGKEYVQTYTDGIASRLSSMHSYDYYNYTYLNKNDCLVTFLSSFMATYIVPMGQSLIGLSGAARENDKGPAKMGQVLTSLLGDSHENDKEPAKKCFDSLKSNLKTNFNLTFKPDSGSDDIAVQSEQICLKSSLEDIVKKLNNVLSLLSRFTV